MTLSLVVLVKQVPNTTQIKIDPVTNNLQREGVLSIVNPYDLYALEAALQLKEQYGGTLRALSMGPRQATEALKYALALGADEAYLLCDSAFAGADTLATSYTLAAALRALPPADLILCGKQAADGDTAQVPVELAEQLGVACLPGVSRICALTEDKLAVERLLDQAALRAEATLPALLTVNKGLNSPRYPSLADLVRATAQEVKLLTAADLEVDAARISLAGSPTRVVKVFSPEQKKSGRELSGSPAEQAAALLALLQIQELL